MIKVLYQKILLGIIAVSYSILLLACGLKPSPEEVELSRQQAEHELVTFMLNYIVQQQIPENVPYIPPDERSISGPPALVSIIIWAQPSEDPESHHHPLDIAQPIRVWLYKDNQLSEAIDKTETIEQYRQDYMNFQDLHYWGFYDFGIVSISDDLQQAKVFWELFCGVDCGHGYMNILERNAAGEWEITGLEWMWIP